ncbi:Beta-lactamase [Indibacter alkaliphilus LW1]|uniref:Beta-lactamase n=1 Tax=Indibacter alkaliphilus (strain CCUG 57479 / KCTC 22604 / LW1) TaxID=1189612 RepID=S2D3K5_INDAL|nr:serine hydrolase [Indibacter alkaliphilus]EOZ91590.1 Beta-lactamase [Indibacter alkaliphilus LW1]
MKKLIMVLGSILLTLEVFAQNLESKMDSLARTLTGKDQPGFVVGVTKGNDVIFQKAYGQMNLDYQMPNSNQTTFNLASVSKHITAFAILKLEEEGKINLDAKIQDYIPELPDYGKEIKVRHLIHHTSGLGSTDNIRLFAGISLEQPWTADDELELIKSYKTLNFNPGDEFLYSNAGYSLLAKIIENVSAQAYDDYIENELFAPLGMVNSYAYTRPGKTIPNRAVGYKKTSNGMERTITEAESVAGGTNIYMSLEDMLVWGKHYFQPTLFEPKVINRLASSPAKLANGSDLNYTFGLSLVDYKGIRLVSHSGGTMGFSAYFTWYPDHDMFVAVAANNQNISTATISRLVTETMLSAYFVEASLAENEDVELPVEQLRKFEGEFKMDDGMVLTFKEKEGKLFLLIPDAPEFELFASSPSKFYLKAFEAQTEFLIDSSGEVNELVWYQGGKSFIGKKDDGTLPVPAPDKDEFLGNYFSADLNAGYQITLKNDVPILVMPRTLKYYLGLENLPLEHIDGDRFKVEKLGEIYFTRDIRKKINGFLIKDVGRLRNISFDKIN